MEATSYFSITRSSQFISHSLQSQMSQPLWSIRVRKMLTHVRIETRKTIDMLSNSLPKLLSKPYFPE